MNRGNARKLRHRVVGAPIFIFITLMLCLGLCACGGGGDGSNNSAATEDPVEPAATNFNEVFIDGLRELTPDLSTSAVTEWGGWCADGAAEHQYSVLTKLFSRSSGWESVYGPVDVAESMLEILEAYAEELAVENTIEFEPGDGPTFTATMTDFSGDFQVPFFNVVQSGLTKQVVITADDDSQKMMIAYDMEGDEKAMVAHSVRTHGDETEYMVFRANFNDATKDLQIWAAAVADKADNFKLQFVWKGNVEDGTFALSQYTNAAKEDLDSDGIYETDGFWKVMGGGSLTGEMAFRANTRDSELDDYFVVATLDDIVSADAPAGFPAEAGTIDSGASPVQSYIDETHSDCLGYLDGFPQVEDLSDWNY